MICEYCGCIMFEDATEYECSICLHRKPKGRFDGGNEAC